MKMTIKNLQMGFGRPGGLKKYAINQMVATANRENSPIDIIGEIRGKANLLPTDANENPGALAGASGANDKAQRLQAEQYTDAPAAARRVDQNGNWNRARWGWLKAITGDGDLSPMARLLAHVLATQFSHHETAHCAPGTDTLADALCTSADTIKRALRDLTAAGWLIRTEGRGRGNRSEIFFLGGNNVVPMICPKGPEASGHDRPKAVQAPTTKHEKGGNPAPVYDRERATQKGADMRGKGGKTALSYIKADPKNIQRAGQPPEPLFFNRPVVKIDRGSHNEESWNAWLAKGRWPNLTALDQRFDQGWRVPFRVPPRADDQLETRIAEKWASIACSAMQERANA